MAADGFRDAGGVVAIRVLEAIVAHRDAVAGQGRATLAEAPRLRALRIEALGTELFVRGRVSA